MQSVTAERLGGFNMGEMKMAVRRGTTLSRRSVHRWLSALLAFVTIMFAGTLSMSTASNAAQSGKGTTITLYYAAPLTGGANYDVIEGCDGEKLAATDIDRKSTRLNSSHANISY